MEGGRLTCRLNNLNAGATATVTIVHKALEGDVAFPAEGQMFANSAWVMARASDANISNNQMTINTRVFANPNPAPAVKILSPAFGTLLVGPTNLTVTTEATDPNGTINKVDIYDGNVLIGTSTPVGANRFSFTWNNVPFGLHSIAALATDNQGRATASSHVNVTVNGTASVAITRPASGGVFCGATTIPVVAQASNPGGGIAKVELFANFSKIGTATTANGNHYSVSWAEATPADYALTAVVTDNAGVTTTSSPVFVKVIDPAIVNILDPLDGASFPASPAIVLKAEASNSTKSIAKVEFYANGALVRTDVNIGATQFFADWNNVPDGIYQLTAVATDTSGNRTTSAPAQISVNASGPEPGELIWFDDALPNGATAVNNNDGWYWVEANPGPLLNLMAHQSRFRPEFHQHGFQNASFKFPVNAGDRIFTYVFLDPNTMPSEIMLEWKAEDGWEHRAYWGLNKIEQLGVNGTNSRRFMGALPASGRWARLEVPAELVGLNGKILDGMSFTLFGGRATFDRTGKTALPPPPAPAPGDVVWFDDALPAGATIPTDERVMKDDTWAWIGTNPAPKSGSLSHRTYQQSDNETTRYKSHAFDGATTPLVINPGDVIFTHIYLDPDPKYRPDQIILQWSDGISWDHRAYWGSSFRTYGKLGTESQRFMGAIPEAGRWVRLEIPASYVGLEGKTIRGMAFGVNRELKLARAAWDYTGKSTRITVPVLPLQSTVPIYRFFNSNEGFSYWLNDIGPGHRIPQGPQWHVYPNQAAGTVPFYRFRHGDTGQFVYTQFRTGPNRPDANWTEDFDDFGTSVSFYIYPDNSTPGVVPLLLYRDPRNQNYFYTANPNDPAKAGMSGACGSAPCTTGYVNATSPILSSVPNPIDDPQFFVRQHYLDFFNREPDAGGLAHWTGEITQCADPARRQPDETELACMERKRVDVSGAFFLSIEFQETGYILHRAFKASFGSLPTYQKFMPDLRTIGQNVIVLQPGWEQLLESNKRAFFDQWVTRTEFRAAFDAKTDAEYVDQLFTNAGIGPQPERNDLVSRLGAGTETRATVLRHVAERNEAFKQAEFRSAFVLMQYFGYLRRHPSDPPDTNMTGYNFWLQKLNDFNGDWRAAEMVKAFITSIEYRGRFGQRTPATTINSVVAGQSVSVKSGAVTSKFSAVSNNGTLTIIPTSPWALGLPPEGYTFYNNLAYGVSTTSDVSAPITLSFDLAWQVDDPARFADLRVLYLEGGAWVDCTILTGDTPAPDFPSRTISARVNALSVFAIARVASSNLAPSVSINNPTVGQNFSQPANITIDANASDPDGSISKVEFYRGDTRLGEDTTAPYSFIWNNVVAGNYILTVRATDAAGVATTSAGVEVVVHGPPAVSITAPSNPASFNAPANFYLNAVAADPDGIRQVEFFRGTTSLGVDTAVPYEVNLSNLGVGTYSLTAVATDNLNATATASPVTVTVSNSAPTVAITSPASGTAAGNAPASITINAAASDSNGIRQVEFFQGATSLGVDTVAPYSVVWNNAGVGTHTLTVKATDNLDAVTTSSPVSVTVVNAAPSVSITSPANGAQLGNSPVTVAITASASDSNGVQQVEFFRDGVSLGVDSTAPYSVTWSNAPAGNYSLTARATDTLGASTTSSPVNVSVGNAAPTVAITSPASGTNYNAPASVVITVAATDNEGIKKVEFFQGATKLGEDLTAPYTFTWSGVATGSYNLTAKATDNLNAVTTSAAVNATVGGALFTLFSDDFNDNAIDPAKWYVTDPLSASLVAERNQRLELTPATASTVTAYNGYASVPFMDMTNAQVKVEVPQYAPTYGHQTIFYLSNSAGNSLMFYAGGGGLVMQDSATGDAGRTVLASYNTMQHRFWRFRHDQATDKILWETSSDAAAWTTQRAVARPFAITSMQVSLSGGKYAGVAASPATAAFDNLKVESTVANTQPAVSITSPANGAVFAAPATATITASASDSDGSITRVEFLSGTTSLGVDTTAPYSVTINNAVAGTYTLTAHATDNRGGITASAPVTVIVNAPPTVSVTAPANGATYTAPATVTLSASASDSDGTIASVEFFRNGTSLGVDTTAPYGVTLSNVAAGSYSLTAKATDNRGAATTSSAITITVSGPNAAPTVSLTAPASGSVYNEPAAIALAATASDSDGTIASVEFFRNGTSLGVDTTAPYSFNWTGALAGNYSLTARATDSAGATTTSAAVSVTVIAPPSAQRADTVGVYVNNVFRLRNSNTAGAADITTVYGNTGWTPIVGDWDGNGTTTLGVFQHNNGQGQSVFHLSNRTDYSYADNTVVFGITGDKPVAGDWDGNGTVTIGVYRESEYTFYLRNTNTPGPADIVVSFYPTYYGETPLAGDWDGDGIDTIGMHRSSNATFYLRNTNTSGPLDVSVGFGSIGAIPVVGDWDGDGKTTVGSFAGSSATFSLSNTNTTGPADLSFQFGTAGNSIPIAGNWDGPRGAGCGDTVWFDDTLPTGAVTTGYNEAWANTTNSPVPFSGKWSHTSPVAVGEHGHYFNSATQTLLVAAGEKLFAYVYLDPANPPTEVMLQWYDTSWEHRAYWGANSINWGVDGTDSRRYMGPLPQAGQWVRLEVPASLIGLEGATVNGMSFNLAGGGAAWDRAGKTTAATANVLISEFRFRGAGGSADEFVELYNNSDAPVTVCATDGSGGWSLVASDGLTRFTVPNGTVIPARGHYLATGGGYGLGAYAASNKPYPTEIADNAGIALFNTRTPAGFTSSNRLDAVGFSSLTNSLYFEGTGLAPIGAINGEYSFVRKFAGAYPQDTGNNADDFAFVSNTGDFYGGSIASMLGGAGPENLLSPLLRNGSIGVVGLDPAISTSTSPNRTRYLCDQTPDCNAASAPLGTLVVRRKIVNNTGVTLTSLRVRLMDFTTLNSPGYSNAAQADLRAINSGDSNITLTDGSTVLVRGTTLEQPPNQPGGGGYNSTLKVPLPTGGLPPGGSVNVQFALGMQRSGTFRFLFITEALP